MNQPFRPHALAAALSLAMINLASAQAQSTTEDADAQRVTITSGRGQLRSVQGLTKTDFEALPAGTSPLVAVSRLPGVNFQSADSLGNYEWSTRITVRSFSQNQLGFTLDDVPLGDMSYGNSNGLHISRAISSENVARSYLSQGTGALDTASSSNLGGTLQFVSSDPLDKFGLQANQTLGSNSNRRTFLRVDSGGTDFGQFYLSYTNQNAEKWKGAGEQRLEQVNFKAVKAFGEHRLSAFVNTSKRREVDYQDLSMDMINRLGTQWDNYYPNFGAAVTAAKAYCGTWVLPCDDAYYAGSGLRDDTLAGVSLDAALSQGLRLKATGYYHHNKGAGLWFTPYVPTDASNPISLRTTEYGIDRNGLIVGLDYEIGHHMIKVGAWHESNNFDQARRFYASPATAVPSVYEFPTNPFFTQWQYKFNTKTDQFSLSDTVTLTKDLTLGLGFKSLKVTTNGKLEVGSGMPSGTISASNGFLPQLGLNYRLSRTDEVFASAARNMRAYQAAATGATPWATTAAGFDAIKGSLKPETSDSFEAGWRTQGKFYEGTLTAYQVNFRDRLLGVQSQSGIVGNPVVLSNVGGVRSVGLEAALSMRLMQGVTWYNSLSQSSSTYENTASLSGKHVVDAPDTMFKSILSYDNGQLFGNAGVDYMSTRYYSYTNDQSVPARTLLNLSGGYRLKALGMLKEASLQASVTNAADTRYLSTVGSNGFGNSGDNQTLLAGAPRQYSVTFSAKF